MIASSVPTRTTLPELLALRHEPSPHRPAPLHNGARPFAHSMPDSLPTPRYSNSDETRIIFRLGCRGESSLPQVARFAPQQTHAIHAARLCLRSRSPLTACSRSFCDSSSVDSAIRSLLFSRFLSACSRTRRPLHRAVPDEPRPLPISPAPRCALPAPASGHDEFPHAAHALIR